MGNIHELEINEGAKVKDKSVTDTKEVDKSNWVEVEVVSEGIFKNGKHYKKGEKVLLHPTAVENFKRTGDVK